VNCDVLIVGLGPVGQLLANLLGSAGVSVVAIDESETIHELPRAAVIDDEVLRIFQAVGLDEAVLAGSRVQRSVTYVTDDGVPIDILRPVEGHFSHPPLVSIHQPTLERALSAGLERFDSVEVRRGLRLDTVSQAGDRVTAWVRSPEGGPAERLEARWLVACDGGRSPVRSRIGVGFEGSTFEQRWLVLDVLRDLPVPGVEHPHFIGDPRCPTVSLPMGPGRHRWEFMLHPGADEGPFLDPDFQRQLLRPWLGEGPAEIERAVIYTFHSRAAERWRRGRILLAGDAAHLMPPFIGQGFSSGARDAGNLSWKLEAVLKGAPEALLDSYEAERRPHTKQMQDLAVRWGKVLQTTRGRIARVRDRLLPALDRAGVVAWSRENVKPVPEYPEGAFASRPGRVPMRRSIGSLFPQPEIETAGRRMRLDELTGPGWCLVTSGPGGIPVGGEDPVPVFELGRDFENPGGEIEAWLDRHESGWAMLRPDRFVFACGPEEELPRALASRRRLLGAAA